MVFELSKNSEKKLKYNLRILKLKQSKLQLHLTIFSINNNNARKRNYRVFEQKW
jgi:hypothetical protein